MSIVNIFPDGDFNPKFQEVNSGLQAADAINKPHEDYPKRVRRTQNAILHMSEKGLRVNETILFQLHHYVMWDMHDSVRGQYRSSDVEIRGKKLPQPHLIPFLIREANLFPFNIGDDIDIKEWYRIFQEIHPFLDGNGRVGGIILAAHTIVTDGLIVAPLQ